jgi:hypothetical protein
MPLRRSLGSMVYTVGGGHSGILAVREARPPEAPQPRLLDRVRTAVRTRHYSRRTEEGYLAWIPRYIFFHGKCHPAELGGPEVTRVLSSLAVESRVGRLDSESGAERAPVPHPRPQPRPGGGPEPRRPNVRPVARPAARSFLADGIGGRASPPIPARESRWPAGGAR